MLDGLRRLSGIAMILYGVAYMTGLLMQGAVRADLVLFGIPLFAMVAGGLMLVPRREGCLTPWQQRLRNARRGAWALGFAGLAGGIIGPMALSDSNTGPLLGMVVTGPLGFLLGTVVGMAWPVGPARKPDPE